MLGTTMRTMLSDGLIQGAKYVALYSAAPASAGASGTEYTGAYERQPIRLITSASGLVNSGASTWYRLSAGTIVGVGLMSAQSGGTRLAYVPLPAPITVSANMSWTIADGSLAIDLS